MLLASTVKSGSMTRARATPDRSSRETPVGPGGPPCQARVAKTIRTAGPARAMQNERGATVRVDVRSVLRAPVGRRAWAELAYVLVSAPLAALGFGYVLVCLLLGAA